jgi:hypothetical protein
MGKPELGQRVQLLRRVLALASLFAFLSEPRECGGAHRSGTHCVSTLLVLVFSLYARGRRLREKETTGISHLNAMY